jgi:squalene-associated FAD-dependent desaturase
VLVLGAGFAGLAAACELASIGYRVDLIEGRGAVGGRAASVPSPAGGVEEIDNGPHVLLACNERALGFLRRVGAAGGVRFEKGLRLVTRGSGGRRWVLDCPSWLPAPLHLAAGLLRLRGLPWSERLRALRLGHDLALGKASDPGEPAGLSVARWLDRLDQPAGVRRLLWEPLCLAVMNLDAERASAPLFAETLRRAFLSGSRAARLGIPEPSLGGMYRERALTYLRRHGGRVALHQPVRELSVEEGRITGAVVRDGRRLEAQVYLSAVPARTLAALLPPGCSGPGGFLEGAAGLAHAPIVSVHLWYDPHPTLEAPLLGLLDGPAEWVFDRRTHLSTISSGAEGLVDRPGPEIVEAVAESLSAQVPALDGRRPLRGLAVKERRATPVFGPDSGTCRPGPATPVPNLYLAGDWTDTGLPSTLEGAAESAQRAVDAIMSEVVPLRRTPPPPGGGKEKERRW